MKHQQYNTIQYFVLIQFGLGSIVGETTNKSKYTVFKQRFIIELSICVIHITT